MYRPSTFLLLFMFFASLSASAADDNPSPTVATHKQVFTFTPKRDGRSVTLNTFTVNSEGHILACVSDPPDYSGPKTYWLQVYSPERVLLNEISLPFDATAISESFSGAIFIAGGGQMGSVSKDGKLIATADTPNVGDRETLIKQTQQMIKEDNEEMIRVTREQAERLPKRIKALEEETELSERDQKRLEFYREQLEHAEFDLAEFTRGEMLDGLDDMESVIAKAMKVTSLAVNSKYVFVCCSAGGRYNVWRTNHHFSEPLEVVSHLSGCCGQCDIEVDEHNLILAENTKFKVSLLDLDGKRLTSFGSSAEENDEGFGSCCNPMNLRCCSNGDILTAESCLGWIKRFNKEGELVGTVGKAKIGLGCKHVAIGFDGKLNRYYMQYQDKNQIRVMLPLTEAPEFTVDELNEKEAREGLGKLLSGDGKTTSSEWSVDGTRPELVADEELQQAESGETDAEMADQNSDDAEEWDEDFWFNFDADANNASLTNDPRAPLTYMNFSADGELTKKGGNYTEGIFGWKAAKQNLAKRTLLIYQLSDDLRSTEYRIRFVDDNTIKVTPITSLDWEYDEVTFKRLPVEKK